MADFLHVCVLLTLYTVVYGFSLVGKGSFCRDPDTGKLHDINATWPSKTFCGSYTCKLRKRNATELEYKLHRDSHGGDILLDTTVANEENETINTESKHTNAFQILYNQNNTKSNKAEITETDDENEDADDRYLTEIEISTITKILRTTKKSELDSMVDMYSLAQDIIKEIDKITDPINYSDKSTVDNSLMDENLGKTYWYERNEPKVNDMHLEGSNIVTEVIQNPSLYPYYQGVVTPFIASDFAFYTPNKYKSHTYTTPKAINGILKPTYETPRGYWYPWLARYVKPESKTMIKSPMLDPFYYKKNITNKSGATYQRSSNNIYKRARQKPLSFVSFYQTANPLTPQVPEYKRLSEITNIQHSEEVNAEKQKRKLNKHNLADWHPEDLPLDILKEVKANILINRLIKQISLRNRIRLDKVGKVIKLGKLSRIKKHCDDETNVDFLDEDSSAYEAYLEKIECNIDTKPGFYRKGDAELPYPACCPLRINFS